MKIISNAYKLSLFTIILLALNQELFPNRVFQWKAFFYFTIQSNFLVMLSLFIFICVPLENRFKSNFRGITLISIIITGFVYNFLIYKIYNSWGTPSYSFSRTVTHVVSPIGIILDWILFDEHNFMKWSDIFIWMIHPIIYCVASIYAAVYYGGALYFFFDFRNGYIGVLKWIGLLTIILFVIGFLIVGLDKFIRKKV